MSQDTNKKIIISEGTTIKGGVIPTTNNGQRPAPPKPQQGNSEQNMNTNPPKK